MREWRVSSELLAELQQVCGVTVRAAQAVAGGDIHRSFRLELADGGSGFLKLNAANQQAVLAAEAASLQVLAVTGEVRVPQVLAQGQVAGQAFLLLAFLPLGGRGRAALLGAQLAALHRHTAPGFGFAADNFIGTTAQPNGWRGDWLDFWRERRLGFQLRLARECGYGAALQDVGERLLDALPQFFVGYTPQSSLLHGDLWGGNHGYLPDGTPVLFDPASYYGDRECDLAMTELFGGYPADFYAAYRAAWPLDAGYATRRELYNLYHILNHAHLFGGGYARQAQGMMQRLLATLG